MEFFDLHCHPAVKTLFKEQKNAISAWIPITLRIRLANGLESQSSLDQICDANINLVCFTRHAVERGIVDQWLLRLASNMYYQLDKSRLIKMAQGSVNYSEQLKDEWTNLNKEPHAGKHPSQKVKFLQKISEYDRTDKGTLYLIFNVEGGHLFNDFGKDCDDIRLEDIRALMDTLQKECPKIFYFTPTHLTPNNLITHAYGNKILSKKPFLPKSYGICSTGIEIIKEIYSRKILIDVKHMSLISRCQFYKLHKEHFSDRPIIASHIGFTGLSWENLIDRVKPIGKGIDFVKIKQDAPDGIVRMNGPGNLQSGHTKITKFNPNSINLYDEEIEYILKSGGLIGLIFDVRILGAEIENSVTEFLSEKEYKEWQNLFKVPNDNTISKQDYYVENEEEVFYKPEDIDEYLAELELYFPGNERVPPSYFKTKSEAHLLHFINHLLYIVVVCTKRKLDINPWKQICIGSDFDGLIAPMYCCKNVTSFEEFANKLRNRVPEEAGKAGIDMPTKDIDCFINDLFFNNAFHLLQTRFKS